MKTSRFALLSVFVVTFAPALAACDPGDDGPPPQTPQNATQGPVVDRNPGAGLTGDNGLQGSVGPDGTQYASQEYSIGDDQNADSYDDSDPSALTDFHAALDSNGTWVDDGVYGTVWVPSTTVVGPDFVPYSTAGHWVYDDDYVWVSDYEWGWAPFHYGRWVWIDGRGWAWIPGRVYRGAWVAWSVNDGYSYVGWAPMGPAFIWVGGSAVIWTNYYAPRYVYCGRGEVFSPTVGSRVVYGDRASNIAQGMHPYTPATPGVGGGPQPASLGYAATAVPRSNPQSAGLARAQQFSRPSTATSLGAHAPTRVTTPSSVSTGMRPPASAGTHGVPGGQTMPHPPPVTGGRKYVPPTSTPAPRPPPSMGGGGRFGGGGGAGHGGGTGGGGGHHR